MKPKNDEEKYPKKYRSQAPKPSKMKSKIQKILSQKIIEKYVQKRRQGQAPQEVAHATLKGGTA